MQHIHFNVSGNKRRQRGGNCLLLPNAGYAYGPYIVHLNNIITMKSGSDVTQDHSNWYHSKAWVRFPIRLP